MPNGRGRQSNTRYANRQRTIEREQVVQASMVNPVVIQHAQQVIVEAQIVNVDELEAKIQELQARIITKENNIKKVKKELSKIKQETQKIIDNNDALMNALVELDIVDMKGLDSKTQNFIADNYAFSIKGVDLLMFTPNNTKFIQHREAIQDYIKYLESIVMASSNGFDLIKITGGYKGFKTDKKHKTFLATLVARNCGEEDLESMIKKSEQFNKDKNELLEILGKNMLDYIEAYVKSGECKLEQNAMFECGKEFLSEFKTDDDEDVREYAIDNEEKLLFTLKGTIPGMIKRQKQKK